MCLPSRTIVYWHIQFCWISFILFAYTAGDGLRCFCESFVNGAPLDPSPVECDSNKTCHIPNSGGSVSGVCYTKLVLQSDSETEHIIHSCAYVARYNITLASTPCINSSSTGRVVEMVCCSTDYCNTDVHLQSGPHHQSTSSLGESSSLNQGQGLHTTEHRT